MAERRDRRDGREGRGRDPPPPATPEERAELELDYEERLLNPYVAAERGSVDRVIDPADTRREVAAAFELLRTKQERLVPRRHDNMPC